MENKLNEQTGPKKSAGRSGPEPMPELATFDVASFGSQDSIQIRVPEKSKTAVQYGLGPYPTEGMAAYSANGSQRLMKLQRRALGAKDVAIGLAYCGVCHSDIHTIREDWGKIQYPQIVGHELAGKVVAVGSAVSKFKIGARVGVGCMVNSCGHCLECDLGFEQYCENGSVQTYASKDRDGTITQGGYSKFNVVNENFVVNIPDLIDLAHAGPLMCAGITVFSPMRHWNIGLGKTIAVIGLGGLGHMATQIGAALGADVTVFTTSEDKVEDAKRFGAKNVVVNKDGSDFSKLKRSFDFMLDTVPYQHDLERFIPLLKRDATICIVGVGRVTEPHQIGAMSLLGDRNSIAGSAIGGIRETQELIDFCAQHGIRPEITKIAMSEIDDAWEKVVAKKVRYRFVMDMNA
jgi:uncharacterized zinc-type alcohol dehydrogenase-like protein